MASVECHVSEEYVSLTLGDPCFGIMFSSADLFALQGQSHSEMFLQLRATVDGCGMQRVSDVDVHYAAIELDRMIRSRTPVVVIHVEDRPALSGWHWLLPPRDREIIVGDMTEAFDEKLRIEGARTAGLWLMSRIAHAVFYYSIYKRLSDIMRSLNKKIRVSG
jgi:hypothetical protein